MRYQDIWSIDIAVVTETHLKKKHADDSFRTDGISLFRRDREGRRGGSVAVYVSNRHAARHRLAGTNRHLRVRADMGALLSAT